MYFSILLTFIVIIDQITKHLVIKNLHNQSISVIQNVFDITYAQNTGAAFSIFQGKGWFFLLTTPLIILLLTFYFFINKHQKNFVSYPIAMIIGGAIGNYIDRLHYGFVIDFLDFKFWPIFNIADTCIVTGTILLAIQLLLRKDKIGEQVGKNSERN